MKYIEYYKYSNTFNRILVTGFPLIQVYSINILTHTENEFRPSYNNSPNKNEIISVANLKFHNFCLQTVRPCLGFA